MKKISSLHEALIFVLKRLYNAEIETHKMLPDFIEQASSPILKTYLIMYQEKEKKKLSWFKEMFNLLQEGTPLGIKNDIINDLLYESKERIMITYDYKDKDTLLIGSLQTISEFNYSDYCACKHFTSELGFEEMNCIVNKFIKEEIRAIQELSEIEIPEMKNEFLNSVA